MLKNQKAKNKREVVISDELRDDLRFWAETNRTILLRLLDLMAAVARNPFAGIGKPEPLKYQVSGAWSRRLTQEHRIVYLVSAEKIDFLQARYHY